MRQFLTVLFVILTWGLAQPVAAQQDPIRQTIQSQFDAIAADDYARAFSYASPNIKGIFGTPENFKKMVRQGYPMVAQHRSLTMLELRSVAGNLWQRIKIIDQAGNSHLLDYMMIKTPDGWQINAVQLLPSNDLAA